MAIATTATLAELKTLYAAASNLVIALADVNGGTGTPAKTGRFSTTQVDTLITALQAAITAANA